MSETNDNPLLKIFEKKQDGTFSQDLTNKKKINLLWNYLEDKNKSQESKNQIIKELTERIKNNRYISEYFLSINLNNINKRTIYTFLFDLYLNPDSSNELKDSIINLLKELIINLEISKDTFEFIFQKISLIYKGIEKDSPEKLNQYLTLLNTILGDTISIQKPLNYYACPGNNSFELELSKQKISIGKCLTIIINFKISNSSLNKEDNSVDGQISSLIKIGFSNGETFSLDFKYPMFLIAKEIHSDFIKTLPIEEWVNLIFTIVNINGGLQVYFFVNGENKLSPYKLPSKKFKSNDYIDSITFFDKFKGEVSSMSMLIQPSSDKDKANVLNNTFLSGFKIFQQGIWKGKIFDKFLDFLKDINKKDISKDLIFIFTPFNYTNAYQIIENSIENNIKLRIKGSVINHKYQCYQKNLAYLGVIQNFIPIAELFLIYPRTLNEDNLILFLNIIINIVNYRKKNIKAIKEIKFFQILSLFIEKYPKYLFNEKVLELFSQIGQTIFSNNMEALCRSYFKHILLNEKILSKYPEGLQIKFWNKILLFCESDKEQIETFVQMNRICLILRFYDKTKYTEMCCEKHLSMIKDEFVGSKTIMNPPMNQKISNLENILNVIIDSQEPKNVIHLFKLLSMDLSPCLTKFILNIFIKAFEKETKNNSWKNQLIDELLNINYETIIITTFIHSLPDIRYDILSLAYYIHLQMVNNNKEDCFLKFESMIKTCLLPQNMFYATKKESKSYKKLLEQREIQKKRNENMKSFSFFKRGSSVIPSNVNILLNDLKSSNKAIPEIENSEESSESDSESISSIKENKEKKKNEKENKKEDKKEDIKEDNKKDDDEENDDIFKKRTYSKKIKINRFENGNEVSKENINIKDEGINLENEEKEEEEEKIIIIKDEYYKEYFQKIFNILLLWFLGEKIDISINSIDLTQKNIKNPNILKILLIFEKDINNITFTNTLLKTIFGLLLNPQNAFILLLDNIIMSSFLDLSFKYYFYRDEINYKEVYDISKEIILQIFTGSIYSEEQKGNILPCHELDIILMWGDKILTEDNQKISDLYIFIYELLYEFLEKFNYKFEKQMNFYITDSDFDITNYYLKNYLMMQTILFNFSFHFCWDLKDFNYLDEKEGNFEVILGKYFNTIRFNNSGENSISEKWPDYIFFYDEYKRLCSLWNLKDLYKKFNIFNNKKNKRHLFEEILNRIILDKNNKNFYKAQLDFLCYKDENKDIEIITPLIKLIPITLMILVLMAIKFQNEAEYKYWLKEYKNFILFIIIATCNLTRETQTYNDIQKMCIGPIITSFLFLNYLSKNSEINKEKATKALNNIILFSLIIVEYEYNYITKHKSGIKLLSFTLKPLRNDLRMCAIFLLFTEYIKNKEENEIFNLQKLEELREHLEYTDYYKLIDNNKDFNDALYNNNKILQEKIFNNFFTLSSYKNIINDRIFNMPLLKDELEYDYLDDILKVLPLYEKELMKYSNNSLEKNIKNRTRYKIIKKKSFSWNGFWSDKKLFFENVNVLKSKIKNHFTKAFMRPILVPILDIDYYLPEFSGFKKEELFIPSNNENHYKLELDIDKILKLKEQKEMMMNYIRESFGEKKAGAKENFLSSIYAKSNQKLAERLKEISNNLELGKEEEFANLENDRNNNEEKHKYFLGCLVKASHHIKGVCFIDNNKLNFKVFLNQKTGKAMNGVELAFTNEDDDYDQERHTCFGSYLVCHHKDKDLYKITINYNDIKYIFRRRYYYKNSALEIFTTTHKTYYFNFKFEKDRETIIDEITTNFKSLSKIIDDLKDPKDSFDNIIGYGNNLGKKNFKLSKLIAKWKEWKITNFEMLMWVNIYGNRSYNDISQYPVFPWILSNYEDPLKSNKIIKRNSKEDKEQNENEVNNENEDDDEENALIDYSYRDLKKPMGMIDINDDGARKALFMETYETLKNETDQEIKPYIFGSNYSNPTYVCNFLVRIFPFTHISIEMQGNKLDDPNRLFFSVNQSFINSTTQKTDVRELIPEFFYLPEIFLNINEINLGTRDDGVKVNDVLTPCNNNPYEFIFTMKKILESSKISKNIQKWIDLIFGYKSRGKEAEISNNLFTESSYQENININTVENKESYLRLVEFGLIPTQIMNKECNKRDKQKDIIKGKEITDPNGKLFYDKFKLNLKIMDEINIQENSFLLKVGCFSNDKLSLFLSNDLFLEREISFNFSDKCYYGEITNKHKLNNKYNYMKIFYSSNMLEKVIRFYNRGKDVIIGGFYDGRILITNFLQKSNNDPYEIFPFSDGKPILSIELDKEERFMFLGNSIGNVSVYNRLELNNNSKNDSINFNNWEKYRLLTDQKSSISSIYCNNELNLWASMTNDGYICLYTLPLCNLIRVIKSPAKSYSYIFLSDSPLPCIITISDEENSEIIVYSINGKLIFKKTLNSRISSPLIIKDLCSNDHLAFIANNNTIIIISLPDLNIEVNIEKLNTINFICINDDYKTLYAINKNGNDAYIIREDSKRGVLSSILS